MAAHPSVAQGDLDQRGGEQGLSNVSASTLGSVPGSSVPLCPPRQGCPPPCLSCAAGLGQRAAIA
eukprot:5471283-Pyramimonas_sp.AAC.1